MHSHTSQQLHERLQFSVCKRTCAYRFVYSGSLKGWYITIKAVNISARLPSICLNAFHVSNVVLWRRIQAQGLLTHGLLSVAFRRRRCTAIDDERIGAYSGHSAQWWEFFEVFWPTFLFAFAVNNLKRNVELIGTQQESEHVREEVCFDMFSCRSSDFLLSDSCKRRFSSKLWRKAHFYCQKRFSDAMNHDFFVELSIFQLEIL